MKTFEFESEENIASALVEAVKTYTPPAGLQEAIRERLFAKPKVAGLAARPRRWTMRRMACYGAAATVVSLLFTLSIVFDGHGNLGANIAFADVQQAVREMKSAVVRMIHPLQPERNQTVYLLGANRSRKEQNSLVFIHDRTKEKMLVLNPADKTAWFLPAPRLGNPWEGLDPVLKIEEKAVEKLGQRQFNGKTLIGFRLGRTDPKNPAGADAERCEAWIDPQTRLPSRLESEPPNLQDPLTRRHRLVVEYAFNTPLDESLFSMTPPKDYRLIECGPLGPAPKLPGDIALASPVITPLVGIGKAKFGMNTEEVMERLGPPSDVWYVYKRPQGEYRSRMKEKDDHVGVVVEYKDQGFTLFVDRHKGLKQVQSHDGLPAFMGFKAFPGRTDKGIALGSTREQIEKTYGTPGKLRKLEENTMALGYDAIGLWFIVADGKVIQIEAKGGR
jgi:hypothetical protein